MLNLNSLMVGTQRLTEMVEFYGKVFDKEPDMKDENGWAGWQVGACFFGIGEHSEMGGDAKDPGRVMFNLETKDVQAEFDRLKEAGAKVIKEPYDPGMNGLIATLADPDNNYFQLMTPWEEDQK